MNHLDEIKTFRNEREWRSAVQNSHGDVDFSKCSKTGKTLSHNSKGKQVGSFKFLNITPNSTIGQGEIVQEENKNTLEESQEHNHIMQYLADKDINSKIENGKVIVHKSNLNKAKVHVKRLGHDLEVVSGLNEDIELTEAQYVEYKHNGKQLLRRVDKGNWKPISKNIEFKKNGDETLHRIDKQDWNPLPKGHSYIHEEVELHGLNLEDYSIEEIESFMVSEDYRQLDELSKVTLLRYRDKAVRSSKLAQGKLRGLDKKVDDAEAHHAKMEDTPVRSSRSGGFQPALQTGGHADYESKERAIDYAKNNVDKAISDRNSKTPKLQHKRNVRNVGILRATKKLTSESIELEEKQLRRGYKENKISGKDPIPTKSAEKDPEEVNEISKATLGRYLKKAKTDLENKNYKSGAYMQAAVLAKHKGDDLGAQYHNTGRIELDNSADKRSKNMNKAIDKLTKEDIKESALSKYLNTYQDINESLGETATISDWLKHFQRSNDNRFYGKDKSQRTTEAIGAYYANHDLASINEDFASIPTNLLDEVSKVTSKMYINNLVKVAVKEKE